MIEIDDIRKKVGQLVSERSLARRRVEECKAAYVNAKSRYAAGVRAQEVIQLVAQNIQSKVFRSVADVVSRCLASIFDKPYRLVLEFERKRNQTEATIAFERDGNRIQPMSASGGGVVDVASFALRLVAILLSGRRARRLLVLDEPFKFLSAEYRERAREMLSTVSKDMDFQIIMVSTHINEFRLGKVIELGKDS